MNKDRTPKVVINVAKHEAKMLSMRCRPCEIIRIRVVMEKLIMDDEHVEGYGFDHMKAMGEYLYYKGMMDYKEETTNKGREYFEEKASACIASYQANMGRDSRKYHGK